MALLRGTTQGLRVTIGAEELDESIAELARTLESQPEFYRGGVAHLVFRATAPETDRFRRIAEILTGAGITLTGVMGDASVADLAERETVSYLGPAPPIHIEDLQRRRGSRSEKRSPATRAKLSESARSLVADFAGARRDLAARRAPAAPAKPSALAAAPAGEAQPVPGVTLYHRGTVRSGQTLRQLGNIVVVGDVNPGAELIASGDIVVFGTLRGQAHAGAQGDTTACVTAVELDPTQLRIATLIAAGEQPAPRSKNREYRGEEARIEDNRIVVVPVIGGSS